MQGQIAAFSAMLVLDRKCALVDEIDQYPEAYFSGDESDLFFK